MAVRTSPGAVESLLTPGGDYDTVNRPSLQPFIDTASAIVDRVATCATADGFTLSATEKELIERWLASHCYCMSDRQYRQRSTLKASGSFVGLEGMGLQETTYGRTAMSLDPSGCLLRVTQGKRVSLEWLGKPPSNQIDYVDRD